MHNALLIPAYVPDAIAAEMQRAINTLTALGVPECHLQPHYADIVALLDAPIAYSLWYRGTVAQIAPLLVPLAEAGFGFNVVMLTNAAMIAVQFHAATWVIQAGNNRYKFGRDCAGFWGADSVYGGVG